MLPLRLVAIVDEELRWREAELSLAKINLQRSIGDSPQFRFCYRCFVAMTYAHFEAFTKRIIAQAMQDLFSSGHLWSKCLPSIRTHLFAPRLRVELNRLSNADLAMRSSAASCLIDSVSAPSLDIILECGNMNVTNFFWAVESIGLDPAKFAFARRDVGHLASVRHDCAHGEMLTFDPTKSEADLAVEMYDLQNRVLVIMHTLAVELMDHFNLGRFLEA